MKVRVFELDSDIDVGGGRNKSRKIKALIKRFPKNLFNVDMMDECPKGKVWLDVNNKYRIFRSGDVANSKTDAKEFDSNYQKEGMKRVILSENSINEFKLDCFMKRERLLFHEYEMLRFYVNLDGWYEITHGDARKLKTKNKARAIRFFEQKLEELYL